VLLEETVHVVQFNNPGSTHSFRLAYELADGTTSPWSEPAEGKTWSWDDNFDGLPDDWQSAFWGIDSALWPGPKADSDGDGASNQEEFLAGTDPLDGESVLKTRVVQTEQGLRLSWNAQPGYVYQVQVSTDVDRWNDLGGAQFAPGNTHSIPLEQSEGAAYYRVVRLR
jgi:hypothetical protein